VSEVRDDFNTLPRGLGAPEDDAVLLGLGYSQPVPGAGQFDVGIGTTLDSSPNPYLKGRYRLVLPFLEHNLLRLRETLFWQREDGVGTTTRFDLDRLLSQRMLARWTGSATWADGTEGVRWFSSVTLYQAIGARRALAYQVGASGETLADVALRDYGLRLIYRQRFLRDWLFLELRTSVSWPRETLPETRGRDLGIGAAVEMWFGERASRT
jgi:hypothetical protein